jgi:hypothetical protein
MWYKREEQSVLNSIWYCMSGVQLMVSFYAICLNQNLFISQANKIRSEAF